MDRQQRNVLIVGALVGAVLGAGVAWLLRQSSEGEGMDRPIRPGEVFKLTSHMAGLLREVDDMRRRM
jgi:hypothetical protein